VSRFNLIHRHNPGFGDKFPVVGIRVEVSYELTIHQARYNHRSGEPEGSRDRWQVNFHEVDFGRLSKQADIWPWLKQVGSHLENLEFDGINPGDSLVGGRGCLSANVNLSSELGSIGSLSEGDDVHLAVIHHLST
jgi:hypothetical protein